jgi:KUP system potassium uptake protein
LSVVFENTPRIVGPNCSVVDSVGEGLWHVVARFGFFEIPDLRQALISTRGLGAGVDFEKAMFVGTRDLVVARKGNPRFRSWRMALFAFLYRNSAKIVDRFNLNADNVVEIARQIEI